MPLISSSVQDEDEEDMHQMRTCHDRNAIYKMFQSRRTHYVCYPVPISSKRFE